MKIKYTIEVEIDEQNIAKKYPNYRFVCRDNKKGYKEFADTVIEGMISSAVNYEENSLELFGYKIERTK